MENQRISGDMQRLLEQLRAARDSMGLQARAPEKAVSGPDFGSVLRNSIDAVNQQQQKSAQMAKDFELGVSGVNLHETVIAGQKASISFQALVQVRNRVVAAYQEIMNMPV